MKMTLIYVAAVVFALMIPTVLLAEDPSDLFQETLKKAEAGDASSQFNLGVMYSNGDGVRQDYTEAAKWFTKAADQGHASAQFELGIIYAYGKGVPHNYAEGVRWYTRAAQQEHTDAQYNLGVMYSTGLGVPQDDTEAVKWYTKAAQKGHLPAQTSLGFSYIYGQGVPQDYTEAVKWYTKAAEHGDAEAQYRLGLMYDEGRGIPQDYSVAAKWFTKAAQQEDACAHAIYAQYNLGVMYANGRGVLQNYREAFKWWTKAAEQGDASAQFNLGLMYHNGQGVPEDYVQAYKWWNLAAAQGLERAKDGRDFIRTIMSPSQVAEAQRLSREFVPRKERAGTGETATQRDPRIKGFGSGFFISNDGLFVTAAHVVEGASEVRIFAQNGEYMARTLFADGSLDIAVLRVEGARGVGSLSVVPSGPVRTGDAVFTLGFPQVQLQGAEAKFTDGSISSLSGIGGDPKFFQISVPVQPGNSGGPLVDASGNVVGIIVSRLDEIETLLATGSLPQNVNYALKSSFVLPLLESLPGVQERLQKPVKLDRPKAIEKAANAVGLVVCME